MDPDNAESASAVPGLIQLVEDPGVPEFTRRQAAMTLGRIGVPAADAVAVLAELLATESSSEESTRIWAAKALALFGPPAASAAPVLLHTLRDKRQPLSVRQASLEAVARIGAAHRDVVPALIELLSESTAEDPATRAALQAQVADAIALLGPAAASAVPALLRAAQDENESVRRSAMAALGSMGPRADVALPTVAEALAYDESAAVRDAAGAALARIGESAIPVLKRLLQRGDAEQRWRAAAGMAAMGSRARPARDALLAALDDENALVRIAAAEALLAVDSEPAAVLATLLEELTSEDRQIRMRAVRLLVGLGPKARPVVEDLKAMLDDRRGDVRRAAAEALREIDSADEAAPH